MRVAVIRNEIRTLADHARDFLTKAIQKYGEPAPHYHGGKMILWDGCHRYPYVMIRPDFVEGDYLLLCDDDGYTTGCNDLQTVEVAEAVEQAFIRRGLYV